MSTLKNGPAPPDGYESWGAKIQASMDRTGIDNPMILSRSMAHWQWLQGAVPSFASTTAYHFFSREKSGILVAPRRILRYVLARVFAEPVSEWVPEVGRITDRLWYEVMDFYGARAGNRAYVALELGITTSQLDQITANEPLNPKILAKLRARMRVVQKTLARPDPEQNALRGKNVASLARHGTDSWRLTPRAELSEVPDPVQDPRIDLETVTIQALVQDAPPQEVLEAQVERVAQVLDANPYAALHEINAAEIQAEIAAENGLTAPEQANLIAAHLQMIAESCTSLARVIAPRYFE